MRILFDGLYDMKEFILMVDIYQWCDKQEAWGGKGYIIQDWYINSDKEKNVIDESDQSKVIWRNSDCVIVTPYYKQLSWLFHELHCYVGTGNLNASIFLRGFSACCEEYFKKTPDHSAKELMLAVLEYIQRENDKKMGYVVK